MSETEFTRRPACLPLFILNEREMTIRVDCRAISRSAKMTLIEYRGNVEKYECTRTEYDKARVSDEDVGVKKLGWKNVLMLWCETSWNSVGVPFAEEGLP